MTEPKRGETFVMQGQPAERPAPVDFTTFVLGLASTALIHLGSVPNPDSGKTEVDLVLARQSLDLLVLLKDKTRGNLTPEESAFFENLLADLQLKFVEATRR